jgi:hypothetical protein
MENYSSLPIGSKKGISEKNPPFISYLPIVVIVAVAAVLRFYQLGSESLWIDEMLSIRSAENLNLNSRVVYFLCLRLWLLVSENDAWLRSLSVIFGIACIVFIYKLGLELFGRSVGLISALLATLSPLFIFHSQEVRMYMLTTLLTLIGSLFLVKSLKEPDNTLSISVWSLSRLLSLYTVPLNVLLLCSDFVIAVYSFRKNYRAAIKIIIGFAFIILLWIPTLHRLIFVSTASFMQHTTRSSPGIQELVGMPIAFNVYWPLRVLSDNYYWFYGLYSLMALGLIIVALVNRKYSRPLTQTVIWSFLPLTALLFASYAKEVSFWTPRYLIFICPYVFFLLSLGWLKIWDWKRSVAIIIGIIYALAVGGGLFSYYSIQDREDWRSAIATINTNQQPNDVVIIPSPSSNPVYIASLNHYHDNSPPVEFTGFLNVDGDPEELQAIQNLLDENDRAWILIYDDRERYVDKVANLLSSEFNVVENQEFVGHIHLFLLAS